MRSLKQKMGSRKLNILAKMARMKKKKGFLFSWHKNRKQSFRSHLPNMIKKIKWEWNFSILTFQNHKNKDSEIFRSQSNRYSTIISIHFFCNSRKMDLEYIYIYIYIYYIYQIKITANILWWKGFFSFRVGCGWCAARTCAYIFYIYTT